MGKIEIFLIYRCFNKKPIAMVFIQVNGNNINDDDYMGDEFKDTRSIRQGWFVGKDVSSYHWTIKQERPYFFSGMEMWKRFDRRKEEKGSCKRRTYKWDLVQKLYF